MYSDYITMPTPQLRIETGHPDESYVNEARRWKSDNDMQYRKLAKVLLHEVNFRALSGSKSPVSLRDYRRRSGIFYSNNLDAAMARELEHDFPELEGKLGCRKSRADGYVQG